uniref:Uncharacterized protein n=1 Tax=Romanomermis culicivorax TaxID=13658 RepID=A0A915JWE7_ROMCU
MTVLGPLCSQVRHSMYMKALTASPFGQLMTRNADGFGFATFVGFAAFGPAAQESSISSDTKTLQSKECSTTETLFPVFSS